jgi:uncharacterized protein DUF6968
MKEIMLPSSQSVSLGEVIAERIFAVIRPDGAEIEITVKLGKPFKEDSPEDYRCPLQIVGVGNERIYAPWGEDPFVALQYALDYIGVLLDEVLAAEQIRFEQDRRETVDEDRWIWRYPPDCRSGRH